VTIYVSIIDTVCIIHELLAPYFMFLFQSPS